MTETLADHLEIMPSGRGARVARQTSAPDGIGSAWWIVPAMFATVSGDRGDPLRPTAATQRAGT